MNAISLPADTLEWEESLLDLAIAGDRRAFERLYREHVGRVHALCLRLTRDTSSAEDCTQQTFIKAWSALRSFETRSAFATWLHRIAVNVVLDHRRRGARLEIGAAPAAVELPGHWILDTPVEVREIETAIMGLPEGARDVLVLSALCGHSHAEVAGMLGIAEGTCKAQLHRARQLLRARLNLTED